jgi:hypothetical protein
LATSTHLRVYGLPISVRGDWPEVVEALRLDYEWFATDEPADGAVEVLVERRPIDFDVFGDLRAAFVTPRNTVYRNGGQTIVDHIGRAVSVIDRGGNRMQLRGLDEQIAHDAAYYFLLGRIGKHLDSLHLPRLHALGIAGRQGALALLLPPGGGKSTLAIQALKDDGVRLLSEDSPLLDRRGRLHPFPLRLAINESDAGLLPRGGADARRIERFWLHSKVAIEVESFADRIAAEPEPLRHIVIGRRSLGREPRLAPLPRRSAVSALLREGVFGVGLYQGLGYAHQRGLADVGRQLRTAAGRSLSCGSALARARVWELVLSRDAALNWDALRPLVG